MAHFVKLDENNIVIDGCVVNNDCLDLNNEESSGIDFLHNLFNDNANWKQTSYNAVINGFRKNYAGIGYFYDANRDAFTPPKCHQEAILNEEICQWICDNPEHKR